ncbi:MAG: 30S ribosome-binding factor RbfA [Trueperaceae bacterium]
MDRNDQLERSLARLLSDLLPTLKDPRIPLVVTVERVHLTPDKRNARVQVSTLDESAEDDMLAALNGASGFLQRRVADELELRLTPRLSFHSDPLEVLR